MQTAAEPSVLNCCGLSGCRTHASSQVNHGTSLNTSEVWRREAWCVPGSLFEGQRVCKREKMEYKVYSISLFIFFSWAEPSGFHIQGCHYQHVLCKTKYFRLGKNKGKGANSKLPSLGHFLSKGFASLVVWTYFSCYRSAYQTNEPIQSLLEYKGFKWVYRQASPTCTANNQPEG